MRQQNFTIKTIMGLPFKFSKLLDKSYFTILYISIVFVIMLLGCQPEDGGNPSPEDIQLGKLIKTWKFTSVTLDGKAQSGYEDLQIILTRKRATSPSFQYKTSGRPLLSPWPSKGTFSFDTDNIPTGLVRDAGTINELQITYSVTNNKLRMSFSFSGDGYRNSRIANVTGAWVFEFKP